ncbi:MAG: ribonuclease Y [bacterium]
MTQIIFPVAALIVGTLAGYFLRRTIALQKQNSAEAEVTRRLNEAKNKEKEILIVAKDKAIQVVDAAKNEEQERRQQIIQSEERIAKREESIDRKYDDIERKRSGLEQEEKQQQEIKQELKRIRKKQILTLEKVASLSREKAKDVLLDMVEKDVADRLVKRIQKLEKAADEKFEEKAQWITALAIQRYSQNQASEITTTTVSLPSDEMKGRIIGKEGRNIKRIEELTGVEIVVDDTPEAIVISGFNPIRRHVAKKAIEQLVVDGRIHPARIEESVEKAKQEIAKDIRETGEQVVYDLGITDFDPKLVQLIGRLKFRYSYGQNVMKHSIEVANISAILAEELGANVQVAKRGGILHDIGKAVDAEIEGTHIEIGKNILKKFGVSEEIIQAMEAHHEDVPCATVEAMIVDAADSISGSRPGARKDTYENYIKRLEELEGIANNFAGIDKSYAIQAGREVRVFVKPEEIDDLGSIKLANEIADKIEQELKYPGEIKVNVIRETRAVEYAK